MNKIFLSTLLAGIVFVSSPAFAQAADAARPPRQMEALDRGVVAVKSNAGTFVSWRLLGNDPEGIAFNVYRGQNNDKPAKLNDAPLAGPTHFVDPAPPADGATSYSVRPVVNGVEGEPSKPFALRADVPGQACLTIPLQLPPPVVAPDGKTFAYGPNDASAGDLDGDGEYELVVKVTARAADNAHWGPTDPTILQAYKLDGTHLWNINIGPSVRSGSHYTQFMVYDFDGDGRAEIICKTSDGTVDGVGGVIGNAATNHVNGGGFVSSGPEYLTVFDGPTGAALDTTLYIPSRHPDTPDPTPDQLAYVWGDGYANRSDRFLAGVAYLDGERPSVVMARGYYTRSVLAAWDFRDGKLTNRWVFDTLGKPELASYMGQGNHNLSVADVDGDGRDEIVYGSMAVDDDGRPLHTTKLGHGDALHVSDFDPDRPGLEVYMPHEGAGATGVGASFRDAGTGEIIWTTPGNRDVGRGMAADIDPRHRGAEFWCSYNTNLYNVKGEAIGRRPAGDSGLENINFGIWWDGDLLRELQDHAGEPGQWHGVVTKWNWEKETTEIIWEDRETRSNNWTKGNPCLAADLFGDWREEMVWRSADNTHLRIYTTTIPTEHRLVTLMHDPHYRLSIAWQNTAYNQPPHTGFFLGQDMPAPPRPNITPTPAKKAVYIVGDSTARNNAGGARGWGDCLGPYFDADKVVVHNHAMAGRSSRTFFTEGRWDAITKKLKAGDVVLIQMGHNDGGPVDTGRARGSLGGIGEETRDFARPDGTTETVHTYGWYLRRFVMEAKAKGATPILMSLTVRNLWRDDKVRRDNGAFAFWSAEVAKEQNVPFVDVTAIIADRYDYMGAEAVQAMFGPDYVHTSPAGADLNAGCVAVGLAALPDSPFAPLLTEKGREAIVASNPPPKPTLWLIGDSTVQVWTRGQLGWGTRLGAYFDKSKITVVNRALGGRSSRTFRTEGHWERILGEMKPGDFVMMQFGHNDRGRPGGGYPHGRASLGGNGDETIEVDMNSGEKATVHSYGWYLRQYALEAQAKGATPIVLSMVPRNDWVPGGKVARVTDGFGRWAREAAEAVDACFIDLNAICADRMEALGQDVVNAHFPHDHNHTSHEGARMNALSVVVGVKREPGLALKQYLTQAAAEMNPPPAPEDVIGVAGPAGVLLTWRETAGAERYHVQRLAGGEEVFRTIAIVAEPRWKDAEVVDGAEYRYRILSVNEAGPGTLSAEASVKAVAITSTPDIAKGLRWHAAFDESGNFGPGVALEGTAVYAPGVSGQALVFDGATNAVVLPPFAGTDFRSFTVAAWVRFDSEANWQRIFDFGNGVENYVMLTRVDGKFQFSISKEREADFLETSAPALCGWNHVAVTFHGNRADLYVDGVVRNRGFFRANPGELTLEKNYLGKSQYPDPLFKGAMDDVRLYDRPLSPAEIARLAETR